MAHEKPVHFCTVYDLSWNYGSPVWLILSGTVAIDTGIASSFPGNVIVVLARTGNARDIPHSPGEEWQDGRAPPPVRKGVAMPVLPKSPSLARNAISAAGAVIAFVALTNTIFLVYIDSRQIHPNPYLGILAWIVAPAILSLGVLIFLAGLLVERRRRRGRAPDAIPEFPRIDLNVRRTRAILIGTSAALIIFVTASVIGSYQAYHYTESNEFCGTACHQPMHPEYSAYHVSPHARVDCVECHVGGGATWYVRSKITGSHQLFALVTGNYPRPIPTPVDNMRPARETCEQCHWPEKFFGTQLKVFNHYQYDEQSTPKEVKLLVNVGGGSSASGPTGGIHWHMNIANEVTYVATDRQRQDIPWVRIKDRSGRVTEYRREDSKLTAAQLAAMPARRMDCIDCHSRPAHNYVSPDRAVDRALLAGTIDRSLPFAKRQAVTVLAKDYSSTPQAVKAIGSDFGAYYQKTYPAIYASRNVSISRSAATLQQIFQNTRFPEMRVDWRSHRDNVGHLYSLGCFRCHDDQHVSRDGKRISKECNLCHTVLGETAKTEFTHPVELGDLRSFNCADCHSGAAMAQ
jgi:nitrate/TMAO reductase-like tetraheme cytochrome c subunit